MGGGWSHRIQNLPLLFSFRAFLVCDKLFLYMLLCFSHLTPCVFSLHSSSLARLCSNVAMSLCSTISSFQVLNYSESLTWSWLSDGQIVSLDELVGDCQIYRFIFVSQPLLSLILYSRPPFPWEDWWLASISIDVKRGYIKPYCVKRNSL